MLNFVMVQSKFCVIRSRYRASFFQLRVIMSGMILMVGWSFAAYITLGSGPIDLLEAAVAA